MPQRALLVIDLQNEYFPTGKLPLVGIEAATANAARVIADARANGVPVIHVRHEAAKADAAVFTPGTPNTQIHASVAPVEGEAVIVKHFPNSFRETPLKALKWMFSPTSPLLFRPQMDPAQWRWGLQFLAQCNDAAFDRNVAQLVATKQLADQRTLISLTAANSLQSPNNVDVIV